MIVNNSVKQEFIKKVWSKVKATDAEVMDVVINLAYDYGIDIETAAKIINSDGALKQLFEQQARSLNQLVKSKDAIA